MEGRHDGFTEHELEILADKLSAKLGLNSQCKLTPEQQDAVLNLLAMKNKTVRMTLWIVGALIVWILQDVYFFIADHITWGWGK